MSGFRDTFTKDQEQEGLLGYDDTAFYYFASSVLITIALPWTYYTLKDMIFGSSGKTLPGKSKSGSKVVHCKTSEMIDKKAGHDLAEGRCANINKGWWLQVLILIGMWFSLAFLVGQMGRENEINRFDPFELLEVSSSATNSQIKKAYHKLSLVYHPDKNPDDPLAQTRFIQITKAYAALTDETAKRNYEKYGNPDGPQTSKVGIGLPRFLLEKENQLIILCIFFGLLLFVVPMTFICYYQRTKNYAGNGVLIETLHFMTYYINESTRVKNCPELLAASAESRAMPTRPADNNAMRPIGQQVLEHTKPKFPNQPVIRKSSYLLLAHMQRLHHLMTPELRDDCDTLLKHSLKITGAMVEIACMREWFFTAQAMIEFRRSLVQALDVKMSQLYQIPHFTEEILKHCHRGKNAVSSLLDFVSKDKEQRKGLSDMTEQQVLDVEAFCSHVSDMEVKASVDVEDEEAVAVGDIATVTVQMMRKNLKEGEAAGPVHAPLFPEQKYEEWWIFLVEGMPSTKIIAFEKIKSTERFIEEKLRFPIHRPGKHKMDLHILCDSYAGLDKKVELNFNALSEEEVKREIFVHKEDEDLDLQPTLFQQFMGDFGQEEESEEEEDVETDKKKAKQPAKQAAKQAAKKPLATVKSPEEKAAKSETEDEDGSTKNQADDDDDSSDDSSSDSD